MDRSPPSNHSVTMFRREDDIVAQKAKSGADGTGDAATAVAAVEQRGLQVMSHSPTDLGVESPKFCGPSSSEHTLKVIGGDLKARGIPTAILGTAPPTSGVVGGIPRVVQYAPVMSLLTMDPLWEFQKEEALKLVDDWFDEIGSLYRIAHRKTVLENVTYVFDILERAHREGLKSIGEEVAEALLNNETSQFKLILANQLTLENGGKSHAAQRLFQSVKGVVDDLLWHPIGVPGIQLLMLVALYHYHLSDDPTTGRIMSHAARHCLEMGLNRLDVVEKIFPNPEEREVSVQAFWSVYIFERRVSLGLGIPYYVQDILVDPRLLESALDSSELHLGIMLEWTKLAGKTWQALNGQHGDKSAEINHEELDYLEYQILHWYERIPPHLQLSHDRSERQTQYKTLQYLQIILFVRKSHLLTLIYRPVLQRGHIQKHQRHAQTGVRVAKEAIQVLSELTERTGLIRKHALFFNHLTLTAFGSLLSAVVNGSSLFWDKLRTEFDTALNLIRVLSTNSAPLMRLWQRLEGLRDLQAKLQSASDMQFVEVPNDQRPPPLGGLSLDELFPTFPDIPPIADPSAGLMNSTLASAQMREQLNSLFEVPVSYDSFFDFTDMDWEQPA
ncbi:hypothetical protein LTR84_004733 [Exophiala bonariae]|uniref:Xylanolytic transcriptional activator regulatory domain-containing protein n=1 Tax=Exophiala bonariae TaxID=1690606 RepID=A0AAV9NRG6_9EURO|nr:hypothetical protein LTR84_004733 [Exophiala bonariae]